MKFTRVNEDLALGIIEFHNKYPDFENKDEELSEELINDALTAVSDDYKSFKSHIQNKIDDIYFALSILLYENWKNNMGWIKTMIYNLVYLRMVIWLNYFDLKEMAEEGYNKLKETRSIDLPKQIPEEFNYTHLLDREYYLKLFEKIEEEDPEFKEFMKDKKGMFDYVFSTTINS